MPENDDRGLLDRLPQVNIDSKEVKKRFRRIHGAALRHAHKFIIKRINSVRDAKRNIIIWILGMALLIAATGFQLMWFQRSYRTIAPSATGTYAEAVMGPVDTLNPLLASTSAEQSASYLLFSRLLTYDQTGHLNYDIASNVKLNNEKTTYTVTIRPDAQWHDGKNLTTADIAYTISLIQDTRFRSTIDGWDGVAVKVIDDTTIEFTLQSVYAAFEHLLTFPIVPKHILGSINPANIRESSFSNKPVGSGPFKLNFVQDVDINTQRKVVFLLRNTGYYGGQAKLAKFQLHVYNSAESIAGALTLNEVNAVADLSPADLTKINSKKFIKVSNPIHSGAYTILNTTGFLLKDLAIRQALRLATNTPEIRDRLGVNSPALDLPLTNSHLTGDLPTAPAYDLASAGRILDENGWVMNSVGIRIKDGRELKLAVIVMKDNELEKVLDILVGQWRKAGIAIESRVVDPDDASQNVVQSILQPRNYDVFLYRINIGADPDVFAYWHSSQATANGSNYSNYSNQVSDDALSSARIRVEANLRNAKYLTFVRQWLADVPAIGLYQSTAQYVRIGDVKPFDPKNVLVSPIDRYSDVLDWSVGTRSVYKTP